MSGLPQNPFQPTKIEHDRDPVFWLSSRARQLPANMKHVHVSGSRGSGKTTLLRSLRTADIKVNSALRAQYDRSSFDWFGTYIQFNRTLQTVVSYASEALRKYIDILGAPVVLDDASLRYRVFDFYLELTILQGFVDDIRAISDRKSLHISARDEVSACSAICRKLGVDCGESPDIYFVAEALSQARALFTAIPTEDTMQGLLARLNAFAPGDLLDQVAALIRGLRGEMIKSNRPPKAIVLVDDCESLTPDQQAILNTVLKSFEGRIKFVVAFISGQYDRNATILPNTVLKDDDYESLKLDEEPRERFVQFCEHVTRTRLEFFFRSSGPTKGSLPPFRLSHTLGNPSPNVLLATMVAASMSNTVKSWVGEVKATKAKLRQVVARKNWQKLSLEDNQTPFIEHIIISVMDINWSSLSAHRRQETFAKVVDRKQVAALVYAVNTFFRGQGVPYAGAQTVTNLATGCIRDFLDIMASIYDETVSSIDKEWRTTREPRLRHLTYFADPRTPVRWEVQRAGILRSSKSKWDALNDFTVRSSFDVVATVHGLSELLVRVQRPTEAHKALSSPERGIFAFESEKLDRVLQTRRIDVTTRDIVRVLQRDGFIRLLRPSDDGTDSARPLRLVEFQLHNRLYPQLGISHRGPYERVRLNEVHLADLILGGPKLDPQRWADEAVSRYVTTGKLAQGEFKL